MEGEPRAEPRPPEVALADAVGDDGHLDLLEDVLVVAAHEGVLAPARHEAATPVEVLEPVGQADRVDVRTAKEEKLFVISLNLILRSLDSLSNPNLFD